MAKEVITKKSQSLETWLFIIAVVQVNNFATVFFKTFDFKIY